MKNYFVNNYGAIKEIDFTSVIESLLESRGELNQDVMINGEGFSLHRDTIRHRVSPTNTKDLIERFSH